MMKRPTSQTLLLGAALVFASTGGWLASKAFSAAAQTPQRTVTVNVGQGVTGPQGAQGPKGEPGVTGPAGPAGGGAESCPTGSTFGELILIAAAHGPTRVWTCLVP